MPGHALAAGLDVFQLPHAQSLRATILGKNYSLADLQLLEPVFGELLARLRAVSETWPNPQRLDSFQAGIESATQSVGPSIYSDPVQGRLLSDSATEGKEVVGDDLVEEYRHPARTARGPHDQYCAAR